MKRDSVVIYRSLYESLQGVNDKAYKRIMNAILKYSLDGELTQLSGVENSVFQLAKTQIDANNRKYENGKKGAEFGVRGGRPKKEKPQQNPTETPNEPLNYNNLKESNKESYEEIIDTFEFSDPVRKKVWNFVQHCLANNHVILNDDLDGMLVELDFKYETDEQKILALDDAIRYNFFDIRRQRNYGGA